jgi:type I restriction enzyme S subunit
MDFSDEEAKLYQLRPGDLLICEGGDIGRTAIWNGELDHCYYQNHLHRLRPKKKGVDPVFYMYWMDAAMRLFNLYAGQGNLTTIPNLSKGRLSAFLVPEPTPEQQVQIANHIAIVDGKVSTEESRLNVLMALYGTLLRHLLAGKVRFPLREVSING